MIPNPQIYMRYSKGNRTVLPEINYKQDFTYARIRISMPYAHSVFDVRNLSRLSGYTTILVNSVPTRFNLVSSWRPMPPLSGVELKVLKP